MFLHLLTQFPINLNIMIHIIIVIKCVTMLHILCKCNQKPYTVLKLLNEHNILVLTV